MIKKIVQTTTKVEVTKWDGSYDVDFFLEFTDSDLAETAAELNFTGKEYFLNMRNALTRTPRATWDEVMLADCVQAVDKTPAN